MVIKTKKRGGGGSPLTTKGDLFGFTTADARIPVSGNDGFVLTEDSVQSNGVKWAANPAGFVDPMTTRGDMIKKGALNTERFALGSAGQIPISDGLDPVYRALIASDIPSLNASKITAGLMGTARLGSGVANNKSFLRGDQTWEKLSNTIIKPTDQIVNNSIILQDDTALKFSVVNGISYSMTGMLVWDSGFSNDIKFGFRSTAAGNGLWEWERNGSVPIGTTVGFGGNGSGLASLIKTSVDCFWRATADGEIILEWAQIANSANDTTMRKGSFIEVREI